MLYQFDLKRYQGDIFDKFVSHILSNRDNSIPLHCLTYENRCVDFVDPQKNNLVEIMKYAASHNVQQLTVNARTDNIRNLELPPSIFNCRSLTFLKLCLWDKVNPSTKMFPKSLNLPALKTLMLVHLTFYTSDNGYAEPFSTCNMLSTLVIIGWYLEGGNAQGLCVSNSNVSSLTMGWHILDCPYVKKVVFCTPNLTSLTIKGRQPPFLAPSACNLTLLEELNVDYCPLSIVKEDILISWLHLLTKVKRMTLNIEFLDKIVSVLKNNSSMTTQHPCFVKLKSLKVELCPFSDIRDERVKEMIIYLLQNSPPTTFDIIRHVDRTLSGCEFVGRGMRS